jgi:hypothetical protein
VRHEMMMLKKETIPLTMAVRMEPMPLTMAISTLPMVRHRDWNCEALLGIGCSGRMQKDLRRIRRHPLWIMDCGLYVVVWFEMVWYG